MKLGIIEEVQTHGDTDQVLYSPHKEVVKEDRSTTKLRIVFDASAKCKDTISLNDVLHKGPSLSAKLYSLLLKFRVHPIVLTANIEKAYLQININEEHRDYLRFLWYRNLQEESIIRCRFTRVIFGVASSQFLLNETVQTHAKNVKISILNSLGKLKSIFMWKILIVLHKVQKKVLNFIKMSKVDFQKEVSVSGSGVPMTQNSVN